MTACRRGPARRATPAVSATRRLRRRRRWSRRKAGPHGRRSASRPATRPPPSAPSWPAIVADADRGRRGRRPGRRGGGGRRRLDRRHRRHRRAGPGPGSIAGDTAGGGKGQAMRVALREAEGDLVAFVDGDVTNFGPHFVTGLLGPLLTDDAVTLVKGFYQRPLHGAPDGGGRVTELMARPVIDLLFPALAVDPPAAGRRDGRPPVGPREVRPGRRLRRRAGPPHRRGLPLRGRDHRPGRPRGPGPPEPAAVRAAPPGHRHPGRRPGPVAARRAGRLTGAPAPDDRSGRRRRPAGRSGGVRLGRPARPGRSTRQAGDVGRGRTGEPQRGAGPGATRAATARRRPPRRHRPRRRGPARDT